MAIAHALHLDIQVVEKMLQVAGRAFKDTDEDRALRFCITGMSDCSLDECNEFLESFGYKPLGTIQKK